MGARTCATARTTLPRRGSAAPIQAVGVRHWTAHRPAGQTRWGGVTSAGVGDQTLELSSARQRRAPPRPILSGEGSGRPRHRVSQVVEPDAAAREAAPVGVRPQRNFRARTCISRACGGPSSERPRRRCQRSERRAISPPQWMASVGEGREHELVGNQGTRAHPHSRWLAPLHDVQRRGGRGRAARTRAPALRRLYP